jgi:hypothetical protein
MRVTESKETAGVAYSIEKVKQTGTLTANGVVYQV